MVAAKTVLKTAMTATKLAGKCTYNKCFFLKDELVNVEKFFYPKKLRRCSKITLLLCYHLLRNSNVGGNICFFREMQKGSS